MDSLQFFSEIYNHIKPIIDIGILAFLLYKMYMLLVRTNAMQILQSGIIVGMFYVTVYLFQLSTLQWLLDKLTPVLLLGVAVVFQPEIRKVLLKLGQTEWFSFGSRSKHTYVDAVLIAAEKLSRMRRGMLVVFVRQTKLENYMTTGVKLDANLTEALLVTIFGHDTPLHDGATFVQNGKILYAGCFLPLSEQYDIKKTYGTRHRAALGMSENSDAIVLVVSEESGAISLAYDSKLHYALSKEQLPRILEKLLDIKKSDAKIEDTVDERKEIS